MSVMSVKEPVPAAKKQPLAVAKPLKRHCLYAVFDTEAEMQQAEQALVATGVQPQRFSNSRHRSIIAHIEGTTGEAAVEKVPAAAGLPGASASGAPCKPPTAASTMEPAGTGVGHREPLHPSYTGMSRRDAIDM